ncbi:dihydropteroate synthase [Arcanobacterium bovis]|uniref:Dihydropteroate synthase n=1 Tax=Arcanobacterium bovis TaxID=2529275 RepID=A0A4Q9V153_9ACTO|nr:dihydropteroate synthase [Arcanobacterium bovis]TBW21487.1 dihydropteroate synthase [Arcanobacterium bovis]
MEIMGILNVTPDSFSDGGNWVTTDAAIAHGREMISQGATILDIGGESTRPGAQQLSWEQEWDRIADVVAVLSQEVTVSVDTYHAQTAQKAVAAGAHIVNDVTGGAGDPNMFATVAELDCSYILQHGRGNSQTMNDLANYDGPVAHVVANELIASRDAAVRSGIDSERIILDPGLGFAKMGDQNWELLADLEVFLELGHPVLIGQSRKRFLSAVAGESRVEDRDVATATISGLLSETGVWAVRVHNVAASAQAIAVHLKLSSLGAW